jgi:hypothetical protein
MVRPVAVGTDRRKLFATRDLLGRPCHCDVRRGIGIRSIHKSLPLGAEAHELEPWEEAPCFSGFSPRYCQKPFLVLYYAQMC